MLFTTRAPSCVALIGVLIHCGSSSEPSPGVGGGANAGGATSSETGGSIASGGSVGGAGGVQEMGGHGDVSDASGDSPIGNHPAADGSAGGSQGQGGSAFPDATREGEAIGSPDSSARPTDCPAGALLCEDFEAYALNASPNGRWTARTTGAATVVVDAIHAHGGTKAVHFHGTTRDRAEQAYILTQGAPVFPVAGGRVFVRFMLYNVRYPSAPGAHTRLAWVGAAATLAAGGNGEGYVFADFNGIAIERLATNQGFFRNTSQHMNDPARVGRWQCFEFEVDNMGGPPPGGTGTVLPHIWQEGQALTLAFGGNNANWNASVFEALQFSLWSPQTDTMPADYWIDDVVMGTQRVNCPAAP